MSNYTIPGVYSENTTTKSLSVQDLANVCTSGILGTAKRGPVNTPVHLSQWQDYIDNFARGYDTPFLADSYLPYSVYGYFQNGGNDLWVIRLAGASAVKALVVVGTTNAVTFTAVDEGAWGNNIKIGVVAVNSTFTVTVYSALKGTAIPVEVYPNLTNTASDKKYFASVLNATSKYVKVGAGTLTATTDTVSLAGGVDDNTITDVIIGNALKNYDAIDINLVGCVTNITSATAKVLASYCNNRVSKIDAVHTFPDGTDVSAMEGMLAEVTGNIEMFGKGWITVSDPLSVIGETKRVPTIGHILGVHTRVAAKRGIWKACAGTEAYITGALAVDFLNEEEQATLCNLNVNCIINKPGYGIVLWGARTLNTDGDFLHSSSVLLDSFIRKALKQLTEWAVFEPNNPFLWKRVTAITTDFLNSLWKKGGLAGGKDTEAYKVVCDNSVNTEETIAQKKMICQVSYAKDTPAEFIVFSISQDMNE